VHKNKQNKKYCFGYELKHQKLQLEIQELFFHAVEVNFYLVILS